MGFNSAKTFTIRIASGSIKGCELKWPTDIQLCERARSQRAIRRQIGRGNVEFDTNDLASIDEKLFDAIVVNAEDAAKFDRSEKKAFIERLERSEVTSIERDGDKFRIFLVVGKATTEHVVNIPLQKDVMSYNRSTIKVVHSARTSEIRANLEPGGELYDKIAVEATGYDGCPVPIIHKEAVVSALLEEINRMMDEPDPEA